jgi:CMP-N,N'-diacetyllegionaminic acid synthase
MKKIEIEGIIPVKTFSVRVKNKNLRKFANTSLYELKLKQLSKTKQFKNFIVSSESQKVLNIAKKYNFKTHLRNQYYSTSKVPMSEVYSYLGHQVETDYVAWINVTNPLINSEIYDQAASIFKNKIYKSKHDCLLSAIENKENFFYKNKKINFKRSPWPRSQDLKPLISLPFAINILKKKNLIKWGSCVGKNPYFFKLDPLLATDIDNQHNFDFCEFLFKNSQKYKIKIL